MTLPNLPLIPRLLATSRAPPKHLRDRPRLTRLPPVNTEPNRSILQESPTRVLQLNPVLYKGFTITARTFQIHGSGRWTLDLLIGRHRDLRAFSGHRTYSTEASAIAGCCEFGRHIIDGRVSNRSVDDLLWG
jgi:hypothetical protein